MAVLADQEGAYARIFAPHEYPILIRKTRPLGILNISLSGDAGSEIANALSPEEFGKVLYREFEFPYDVAALHIHTIRVSSQHTAWLHCWLFKEREFALGQDEPAGQLSIGYRQSASDLTKTVIKVLDIQLNQ